MKTMNMKKKKLFDNRNLYSHFLVKFTFICNCAFFKKKKFYSFTIQNNHYTRGVPSNGAA